MARVTESRVGGHRAARARSSWRGPVALVVVAGLGAAAASYWLGDFGEKSSGASDVQAGNRDQTCGEQRFSIAADPRVAATVRAVVAELPPDECISVGVRSVSSAQTSADVARAADKGLGGTLPDAWIPDSSLWLDIAGASDEGAQRLDGDAESLASSPVVLAAAPDTAAALGWPDATDWQAVLGEDPPATLALPGLDSDGAALTALPALEGTGSLAELSRSVAAPPLPQGEPLGLVLSGQAQIVASTEQEVAAANRDQEQAVAMYDEAFGSLDFPLVRVRPIDAEDDPAADALFETIHDALTGSAGRRAWGAAGFRTADQAAADGAPQVEGVDFTTPAGDATTDASDLTTARTQWATQGRRARLLLLMDQSGSMAETLPDGRTRAQAAQDALRGLVDGASPDDALGLWGFTDLIGNGDYAVLSEVQPLDATVNGVSVRSEFLSQVDQLAPVVNGSTTLYDTIAAAYDAANADYADGLFNAVVVVTDGRNEDPGSRSLAALVDQIRRDFDGTRPVRIITVAYGENADVATLESIADATAGRSYRALTGDQVQDRLAELLAEL